jgi:fructan beta-fructosidase
MFRALACLFILKLTAPVAAQRSLGDTAYAQALRPQYHYSSRINWVNDPNGLVYFDGEYHLFYQYNPHGNRWGHINWGHAISRDLVHWRELSPALTEENDKAGEPVMIFSGSCVVDKENTSGFGKNGLVPMVSIYTGHKPTRQNQHIAYSLDRGRTWTKYDKNPVIDLNKKDFRDPNVFWHEPSRRWVMVVLLPTEKRTLFYNSTNLLEWTKTGEFTAADSPATVWECPNLVEVPVDGSVERKWLFMLSMGSHGAAGGSGMQYYVGRFDGKTFINESKPGDVRYVDSGKDYYAAITYNNMPIRGNRGAVSIGWMNNLQYANDIPTTPFRGVMTLPRELRLSKQATATPSDKPQYELRQKPIQELKSLLGIPFRWNGADVQQLNQSLTEAGVDGDTYQLLVELDVTKGDAGVWVRKGQGEQTTIGYDAAKQQLYVDRTKSGQVAFKKEFPGRFTTTLKPDNGKINLQIWVDRSSVEVFANEGKATLANLIFPKEESRGIEFFGDAVRNVTIQPVDAIWK